MVHTEHANSSFSMRVNLLRSAVMVNGVNRETEAVRLFVICELLRRRNTALSFVTAPHVRMTADAELLFASPFGRFGGVKRSALPRPAALPTPCRGAVFHRLL